MSLFQLIVQEFPQQMQQLFTEILPEVFNLAAEGKIKVETETVALKDIESLWQMNVGDGKRLVVKI